MHGDRTQNALIDRALAAWGMVVVALDFRVAPAHPYPAQVQDVHYAIRWTKAHATEMNVDAGTVGGFGTSAGGHTLLLAAMRPHDPRYAALPLPEAPDVDSSVAYALLLWPVLDSWARYRYAQSGGPEHLVARHRDYFVTDAAMQEGNPQGVLDRGEAELLPPSLIVQPIPDRNIPREIPERFVAAYRAAGGTVELEWFPEEPHGFARQEGGQTERALEVMKRFIARQLAAITS
jgi:acetyl esterase